MSVCVLYTSGHICLKDASPSVSYIRQVMSASKKHARLRHIYMTGHVYLKDECLSMIYMHVYVGYWEHITPTTLHYSRISILSLFISHQSLMRLLAAEPSITREILFPSQHLCGIILLTLYSTVWDLWVLRIGTMFFFIGRGCSSCYSFLFFLCGLVLWGWGLRTVKM